MATHGALDGFVCLQTLQCLLRSTIIGIAEGLGKLFCRELLRQQSETLLELIGAPTLLGGILQLIVVVETMQFIIPEMLCAVLYVTH